jgi:hypothetical protein
MKSRLTFIICFWVLFFAGIGFYFYKSGNDYRAKCNEVPGTVISRVNMPEYYMNKGVATGKDRMYPLVQYTAGDKVMTYTEKRAKLKVGDNVTVLYEKENPAKARLLNGAFWFSLGIFIPAFSIASFVFCMVLITITNFGKKAEVLPGELDPFIYGEEGPQIREERKEAVHS